MSTRTILIQIALVMLVVISSSFTVRGMGSNEKIPNGSRASDTQEKKQHQLINKGTKQKNYVPGEIIVKFEDDTDDQVLKDLQAEMQLKIIKLVYKPNIYLMKILDNSSVENVMERLRFYKEVIYSEPNYIRSID